MLIILQRTDLIRLKKTFYNEIFQYIEKQVFTPSVIVSKGKEFHSGKIISPSVNVRQTTVISRSARIITKHKSSCGTFLKIMQKYYQLSILNTLDMSGHFHQR